MSETDSANSDPRFASLPASPNMLGQMKAIDEMEDKLKKRMTKMSKDMQELRNKVVTSKEIQKVREQYEVFMQKRENPTDLVKFDEFSYSFGVFSLFLTFGLLFYPNVIYIASWITFVNVILILIRFIDYRQKKWHYFYFDYCYFANFLSWIYMWLMPKSQTAFFMVSMNCFCPLLNYFIIYRAKLIYQSLESLTSFYMHFTPGLLFWILRFFNYRKDGWFMSSEEIDIALSENGYKSQLWVFLLGVAFYALWVVFYYLFIFHIRSKRIVERNYPTLYSYTVNDFKKFNKLIYHYGENHGPITYMILHLTQGVLGCIMSMFLINSKLISFISLAIYLLFPIWNSSIYYFEYFSKDYNEKLLRRADEIKEKRMKRSNSADNISKLLNPTAKSPSPRSKNTGQ